jgi:methylenetetrahydrofolate dehydrogenase (NADP+)/methenyltetrahydrofolate cyclohydrolase
VAHSRTRDLPALTREADVLVVAAGRPRMVGAEHVKPGAVVAAKDLLVELGG